MTAINLMKRFSVDAGGLIRRHIDFIEVVNSKKGEEYEININIINRRTIQGF